MFFNPNSGYCGNVLRYFAFFSGDGRRTGRGCTGPDGAANAGTGAGRAHGLGIKYRLGTTVFLSLGLKFQSLGLNFLSLGLKFLSLGPKFLSLGLEFQSLGLKFLSLGLKFQSLGLVIRKPGTEWSVPGFGDRGCRSGGGATSYSWRGPA